MHILFVTPHPLSRARSRTYGFISRLSAHHHVTVVALYTGPGDAEDVQSLRQEGISITVVHEKPSAGYLRSLCSLCSRMPLHVAYSASPTLGIIVEAYLATGRFDVIHVESLRGLGALPKVLPIPCVWDAVDCLSQIYEQGARVGVSPLIRALEWSEARRVRTYELKNLHRFQHVLVASERERQALLHVAQNAQAEIAEIISLPHGIDQQYYRPYTGPRLPNMLVFSGKMNLQANVAGVIHLIQCVLPRVWRQRADVQLVIAGSDPPPVLRRLAARDPRIELTGQVSDLRPYIAQARIAVSPLLYAVGIQNKVLEAMALGTPSIVSSQVATGFQPAAEALEALFVANGEEAFAAAILHLLEDQPLWSKLVKQGLTYIATHHRWEYIIRQLTSVYTRAIEKGSCSLSLA